MLRQTLAKNKYLKSIRRLSKGFQPVYLEYAVDFTPRWENGNEHLKTIIAAAEPVFQNNLDKMNAFEDIVRDVMENPDNHAALNWRNSFIPVLDALSIMWAATGAKRTFMEVGSGNSTLFAREALRFYDRDTKIISIDPHPREDIDSVCDEIMRQPLENIDIGIFDRLESGDALFVDNSHRSFMNSDVTVFMLEVLPRLKSGVLVGVHDIFLPYDYFSQWSERAYNEQYLLGCYLIANPNYFDIQLANYWISRRGMHDRPLKNIWALLGDDVRERASSAFWAIKT